MLVNRSLTLIGLIANVLGAALLAKYRDFASIKVIDEDQYHLLAIKMTNLGWELFIGGFCFQIAGLLLDV